MKRLQSHSRIMNNVYLLEKLIERWPTNISLWVFQHEVFMTLVIMQWINNIEFGEIVWDYETFWKWLKRDWNSQRTFNILKFVHGKKIQRYRMIHTNLILWHRQNWKCLKKVVLDVFFPCCRHSIKSNRSNDWLSIMESSICWHLLEMENTI